MHSCHLPFDGKRTFLWWRLTGRWLLDLNLPPAQNLSITNIEKWGAKSHLLFDICGRLSDDSSWVFRLWGASLCTGCIWHHQLEASGIKALSEKCDWDMCFAEQTTQFRFVVQDYKERKVAWEGLALTSVIICAREALSSDSHSLQVEWSNKHTRRYVRIGNLQLWISLMCILFDVAAA